MDTVLWLLPGMGGRGRRNNQNPAPLAGIVVEVGVGETGSSNQRLQNMDLAGVTPPCAGEENLVVDCAGAEGLQGGDVAEDSGGAEDCGCFLGAGAMNAVSH